ncbi:tyrosine-type recombinase/integrase [Listeria aquatica]|uniref:tyrosine-type recombinase/integrase n=1 Tax=Listeria aquatica TaxID=1494960 RepID=UPI0031F50C3E
MTGETDARVKGNDDNSKLLPDELIRYRNYMYYKGLTEKTISSNIRVIEKLIFDRFGSFDLTKKQIYTLVIDLKHTLARSTEYTYINILKTFYRFLIASDYPITQNPFENIKIKLVINKNMNVLYEEEIKKIYKTFENGNLKRLTEYHKLIFDLFYSTGMRLDEVTNLKFINFDFENRCINIIGKGKKERIVVYGKELKKCYFHIWKLGK